MWRTPSQRMVDDWMFFAPRDPVVTPSVAAYAAIAASTVAAAGAIKSGQDQKKLADYNAEVLQEKGRETQLAATAKETEVRQQADALAGRQRVAAAVSGVDVSGSPLLAMADSQSKAEMDAINIRNSGDAENLQLNSQAALSRIQGENAVTASYFNATSSLLTGASRYGQIKGGYGSTVQKDAG